MMTRNARGAFSLLLLFGLVQSVVVAAPLPSGSNEVATVSGNGRAGFSDGYGSAGTYMFPAGVAFDNASKTVYVADSAAQRIRKIDKAGLATTVAGSGGTLPSGLGVVGGYRDGPVASSRFNHPTAIAIAKNGDLFVADAFNHCVRKISKGYVSTVSGDHLDAGSKDGPLSEATFREPRGLAFDDQGNLYVADFGNGIRKITADRVLSVPSGTLEPISVALNEDNGGRVTLFYSSEGNAFRYNLVDKTDVLSVPKGLEGPLGLDSIVALSDKEVILSSPLWNVLYIASFVCPLGQNECLRVFAGGSDEDHTQSGAFIDGTLEDSRFYTPLGIAREGTSRILVADAGNRRVREILLPHDSARIANGAAGRSALLITGRSAYAYSPESDTLSGILNGISKSSNIEYRQAVIPESGTFQENESLRASIRELISQQKADEVIICLDRSMLVDANSDTDGGASENGIASRLQAIKMELGDKGRIFFFPLGAEVDDAIDSESPTRDNLGRSAELFRTDLAIERALGEVKSPHSSLLSQFVDRRREGSDELYEDTGSRLSLAGRALLARLVAGQLAQFP